mgnify:CR=1 FL=1
MFFTRFRRNQPVIRARQDHCISRANIDADALKVLYRLSNAGHIAYLVGGSVRDLLLGRQPKDFDIGTDARPNDIRRLFRNCFLIGRRFRLAHIVFGKKVIETSTFRRQPDEEESEPGLYQTDDNTFGTPEEDAKRRDFTVNGLFYDIKTFSVIDYVGGLKDLDKRVLRCIGDPNVRFREDPVRMMRAVKFAARLGFEIDRASRKAILKHHADILNASVPRVCEEIFRLFSFSSSKAAFHLLWEFNLLKDLLPDVDAHIRAQGGDKSSLWSYLDALDAYPANAEVTNGVRLACLFYSLFHARLEEEEKKSPHGRVNRQHLARLVLHPIAERLRIPKATLFAAVSLFDTCRRFAESPKRSRNYRLVRHASFSEALAFQRILFTAERRDTAVLDEWQALHEQEANRFAPPPPSDGLPEDANEPRDVEPLETARRRRRRRRRPRPNPVPEAPTARRERPVTVSEIPTLSSAAQPAF